MPGDDQAQGNQSRVGVRRRPETAVAWAESEAAMFTGLSELTGRWVCGSAGGVCDASSAVAVVLQNVWPRRAPCNQGARGTAGCVALMMPSDAMEGSQ